MGNIEGSVNLSALRDGFFNLGLETISLIPNIIPFNKIWEDFYDEIEIDRISIQNWDGVHFRFVYNKLDLSNIKPIKPLLYSEYASAGTTLSENENFLKLTTISVDSYAVREKFRIPITLLSSLRYPVIGFEGAKPLQKGLEYVKEALNSVWGIKIADLMSYIFFRMITNGTVQLRHQNTNHTLVLGSPTPIANINPNVSNRNWTGTDNPLVAIEDAIAYLRKQTVATRKLPFFEVVVLMNQNTANKLINNQNFDRLANSFELSAYQAMINYIRYHSNSQVVSSVYKDFAKEILVINYEFDVYDSNGNIIQEKAIADDEVIVMIKHPKNLKLGMFALPYFERNLNTLESKNIKVPKEKFSVAVSAIGEGHTTEIMVEYMTAVTGILVEPRLIAKFTVT